MLKSATEIAWGESEMADHKGYPLKLPYLSVFICLEGKAVVQVNFKNHLLTHNRILVVSEDSITTFLRTSPDFKLYYFLIDKELASEIAYRLPNQLFQFLWEYPLCIPEKAEDTLLEMWLKLTQQIIQNQTTYRRILLCNHFQNFFLRIAEKFEEKPTDKVGKHKHSRKEMLGWRFWNLIGENCKQHRDVAFYANKLCITPFYLSQITKHFMNDSPKGLIDRQVILEMKALLGYSQLSVKEIAKRLNFEDTSYMCRFFKRRTGMSFSEYRNAKKNHAFSISTPPDLTTEKQ